LKNNLIQALKRDFSRFYDGYRVCGEYMEREFTAVIGTGINRYTLKGRIDRIGQKSYCRYVDIVVEDTIDERILDSIKANQEVADSILKKGVRGFLE